MTSYESNWVVVHLHTGGTCMLFETVEPLCVGGEELVLLLLRVRLQYGQQHIHLLLKCTIDLVHRKVARKHTSMRQEASHHVTT